MVSLSVQLFRVVQPPLDASLLNVWIQNQSTSLLLELLLLSYNSLAVSLQKALGLATQTLASAVDVICLGCGKSTTAPD
jgi:hypothetical protein